MEADLDSVLSFKKLISHPECCVTDRRFDLSRRHLNHKKESWVTSDGYFILKFSAEKIKLLATDF